MRYRIVTTRQYRKAFKKIRRDQKLVKNLETAIDLLAAGKRLPARYRDHNLAGNLQHFRELHIRPNVLLLYQKHQDILVLLLADLGSHGRLF